MPSLVLLRHGESSWNADNRFTGWVDVDLTEIGEAEATRAGELLAAEREATDLEFDTVHTSVLTRATRTADLALAAMGRSFLPLRRHWRLNERHYGVLQGLNKAETAERHGAEQVKLWRRSYDVPPPPLSPDDPTHPRFDRRYREVPQSALPASECLRDVVVRLLPYYEDAVAPELLAGRNVLVVAHGNSLRAMLKYLEGVSDEDIVEINIPTGSPRLYHFDGSLQLTDAPRYLGDQAAVDAAIRAVANQAAVGRG